MEATKPSAIERCEAKLGELRQRFWGQVVGTVLTGVFAAAGTSVVLVQGIEGVSNLSAAAPSVQVEPIFAGDFVDERKPLLTVKRKDEGVVDRYLSEAGNNAALALAAGGIGAVFAAGSLAFGLAAGATRQKISSVTDALDYHREQQEGSRPRDFA